MKLSVLKIENMVIFAFIHIVSSRAYHNVYKYRTSLTCSTSAEKSLTEILSLVNFRFL